MPEVLTDTSPIQYLYQIDQLDLLPMLYKQVSIPQAVAHELARGRAQGISLPDLTSLSWMTLCSVPSSILIPTIPNLVVATKLSSGHGSTSTMMKRFASQFATRPMQATTLEQLSAADAEAILEHLPERIRSALITHAAEINYPVETVVEMAIASFLDSGALGFADCKPGRGQ